jgi:hypothetical protein
MAGAACLSYKYALALREESLVAMTRIVLGSKVFNTKSAANRFVGGFFRYNSRFMSRTCKDELDDWLGPLIRYHPRFATFAPLWDGGVKIRATRHGLRLFMTGGYKNGVQLLNLKDCIAAL